MLTPCRDDDVVADDAVEVMVVDDEVMVVDDDVSSCLSFTETMQASYCPVNMVICLFYMVTFPKDVFH
ncbi:hypothetical protein Y032_0071g549 [Ancylostoma ceylanicum]|uniref:Uncharacterized protein n=1 Tax=Ancylostoma ceylanicum TaxID=53326 RepID=A0A016TW26_9BILA|nr:hypothetical protein Y032_0071g549 [Ancylostoma ceylanicum]